MSKSINLLDIMNEEDRQKSIDAYKRRMAGDTSYRKSQKIAPEAYLIAELGYYYGWAAIEAAKRGYVEKYDESGNRKQILLTMEEVCVLVEAARKVWYSKVLDQSRGTLVATGSALSKQPAKNFEKGMNNYIKGAKI